MLSSLDARVLRFALIRELYAHDSDFGELYTLCMQPNSSTKSGLFFVQDGFLFKASRLCIPLCSLHSLLVIEAHGGGLMGHFRVIKTLGIWHDHFFCLR